MKFDTHLSENSDTITFTVTTTATDLHDRLVAMGEPNPHRVMARMHAGTEPKETLGLLSALMPAVV